MAYNVVVSFLDGVIANKYRTDASISGVAQLLSGKIVLFRKHFAKWTLREEISVSSYVLLEKLMINCLWGRPIGRSIPLIGQSSLWRMFSARDGLCTFRTCSRNRILRARTKFAFIKSTYERTAEEKTCSEGWKEYKRRLRQEQHVVSSFWSLLFLSVVFRKLLFRLKRLVSQAREG